MGNQAGRPLEEWEAADEWAAESTSGAQGKDGAQRKTSGETDTFFDARGTHSRTSSAELERLSFESASGDQLQSTDLSSSGAGAGVSLKGPASPSNLNRTPSAPLDATSPSHKPTKGLDAGNKREQGSGGKASPYLVTNIFATFHQSGLGARVGSLSHPARTLLAPKPKRLAQQCNSPACPAASIQGATPVLKLHGPWLSLQVKGPQKGMTPSFLARAFKLNSSSPPPASTVCRKTSTKVGTGAKTHRLSGRPSVSAPNRRLRSRMVPNNPCLGQLTMQEIAQDFLFPADEVFLPRLESLFFGSTGAPPPKHLLVATRKAVTPMNFIIVLAKLGKDGAVSVRSNRFRAQLFMWRVLGGCWDGEFGPLQKKTLLDSLKPSPHAAVLEVLQTELPNFVSFDLFTKLVNQYKEIFSPGALLWDAVKEWTTGCVQLIKSLGESLEFLPMWTEDDDDGDFPHYLSAVYQYDRVHEDEAVMAMVTQRLQACDLLETMKSASFDSARSRRSSRSSIVRSTYMSFMTHSTECFDNASRRRRVTIATAGTRLRSSREFSQGSSMDRTNSSDASFLLHLNDQPRRFTTMHDFAEARRKAACEDTETRSTTARHSNPRDSIDTYNSRDTETALEDVALSLERMLASDLRQPVFSRRKPMVSVGGMERTMVVSSEQLGPGSQAAGGSAEASMSGTHWTLSATGGRANAPRSTRSRLWSADNATEAVQVEMRYSSTPNMRAMVTLQAVLNTQSEEASLQFAETSPSQRPRRERYNNEAEDLMHEDHRTALKQRLEEIAPKSDEVRSFIYMAVRGTYVFQNIGRIMTSKLIDGMQRRTYPKGAVLVRQYDPKADSLFCVQSGTCKVVDTESLEHAPIANVHSMRRQTINGPTARMSEYYDAPYMMSDNLEMLRRTSQDDVRRSQDDVRRLLSRESQRAGSEFAEHGGLFGRGAAFGDFSLLIRQPPEFTVVAETDMVVFELERDVYLHLKEEHNRELIQLVQSVPSLSLLDPLESQSMVDELQYTKFLKDSVILQQGEISDRLYIIQEGMAEVVQEETGRVVRTLEAGSAFGEHLLRGNTTNPTTVRCLTDCQLWFLLQSRIQHTMGPSVEDVLRWCLLRQVPCLKALSPSQISALAQVVEPVQFGKHERIFPESPLTSSPEDYLFVIEEGTVLVEGPPSPNGNMPTTGSGRLERGDAVGVLAMLEGVVHQKNAVAGEDGALLLLISRSTLLETVQDAVSVLTGSWKLEMWKQRRRRSMYTYPLEDQVKLASQLGVRQFAAGKRIPNGSLYLLVAGKATEEQTGGAGKTEAHVYCEGDTFGALVGGEDPLLPLTLLTATSDCIVLTLTAEGCQALKSSGVDMRSLMTVAPFKEVQHFLPTSELKNVVPLALLGEGGYAMVLLVMYRDNLYAMKKINKCHLHTKGIIRLLRREVYLGFSVRTPFIARLCYTAQDKRHVYLLQEAVLGGDFFSYMEVHCTTPGRGISESAAKFYAACVVLALEYLHARNIVYRDIKPENMVLSQAGYLKICDLGFAQQMSEGKSYSTCGTLDYMAPEVITKQGHSMAVDCWALGVTIFEMLVGLTPFYRYPKIQKLDAIRKANIFFPSYVSPEGADLLSNLMRVNPTKRLGSPALGGVATIKAHAWFADIDWDKLQRQEFPVPYVPTAENTFFSPFLPGKEHSIDQLYPHELGPLEQTAFAMF